MPICGDGGGDITQQAPRLANDKATRSKLAVALIVRWAERRIGAVLPDAATSHRNRRKLSRINLTFGVKPG
jgi:hypothetical protein